MLIKNLPSEIRELVLKEQLRQGKPLCDLSVDEDMSYSFTLSWADTEDGVDFWKEISFGKFDIFYKKYPEFKVNMDEIKVIEDELFTFLKS